METEKRYGHGPGAAVVQIPHQLVDRDIFHKDHGQLHPVHLKRLLSTFIDTRGFYIRMYNEYECFHMIHSFHSFDVTSLYDVY